MAEPISGMPHRKRLQPAAALAVIALSIPSPQYALADPAQEFAEADRKFAQAWRDQNTEEALPWARKRVEILANQDGSSPQLLTPLLQLTAVELQLRESSAALDTIGRAESILEKQPDDMLRLEFLMFKAQAYVYEYETSDAFNTYGAAVRVNKRIEPYDLLREAMIYDAYLEAAKVRGAAEKRKGDYAADKALEARERYYGKDSIDLIPGLEIYAEWCNFSSQLADEREARERIIEIISAQAGPRDLRISTQAIIIAKSHIYERKRGEAAAEVMEKARGLDYPETSEGVAMRAQALAVSGDVQVMFGDEGEATEFYRSAWQVMADFPGMGPSVANSFFGEETRLFYNNPDQPARSKSGQPYSERGSVTVSFTVLPNGHLDNVELQSDIASLDDAEFYKAARRARYRPRLVDGEPVATSGVQFRTSYGVLRR